MSHPETTRRITHGEFVLLMASLTSTAAMLIDMMLPALGSIAETFALEDINASQLIIVFVFAGFTAGQFVHGPISDTLGRKRAFYIGCIITLLGTVLCLLASDYSVMLLGRFLQGLGAAAARTIVTAIIRDRYSGKKMAQVISVVMTVFIIVPAVAPIIGQLILSLGHWRIIFVFFLCVISGNLIWFFFRQEETLPQEARKPLQLMRLWLAAKEVFCNRYSFGYSLISGLVFGAFIGYLSTSRQIFQDMYLVGDAFPYYFGLLALCFGAASLTNARLLALFRITTLSTCALLLYTFSGIALLVVSLVFPNGHIPLPLFVTLCMLLFFGVGIAYGNLTAMAMEPMKHIAGMASSITGGLSSLVAVLLGALIGQVYNDTLLPLAIGFTICGLLSLVLMVSITRSKEQ